MPEDEDINKQGCNQESILLSELYPNQSHRKDSGSTSNNDDNSYRSKEVMNSKYKVLRKPTAEKKAFSSHAKLGKKYESSIPRMRVGDVEKATEAFGSPRNGKTSKLTP